MQKKEEDTTITVPVPDHGELRAGTLSGIIRQSGLPRSLFEARVGSSTIGRDGLKDLLFMARREPRPVDGIIFWSFSRMARDQLDSQFAKSLATISRSASRANYDLRLSTHGFHRYPLCRECQERV